MNNNITFLHSGCGGDLIASLATVKLITERENKHATMILDATGGLSVNENPETNATVFAHSQGKGLNFGISECEFLKPLLESQEYIDEVIVNDSNSIIKCDYNLNTMRDFFNNKTAVETTNRNLEYLYKFAFGLEPKNSGPWLTSEKIQVPKTICLIRSTRYQSAHLWIAAHEQHLKNKSMFIGTKLEYEVFNNCFNFDPKPQYMPIETALDAAKIINSSQMVIANGTLFYWIAVGLGRPLIINELAVDIHTTYFKDKPNITYIQGGKQFR